MSLADVSQIQGYQVTRLTKEMAYAHADRLCYLINLIPFSNIPKEDVLAESRGERQYHHKWKHSYVLMNDDQEIIAMLTAYERDREDNELYPFESIYLHMLAVDADYQRQGIARALVTAFLTHERYIGFEGDAVFSIQTNSASWNTHVQNFYRSLGFIPIAKKEYDDRVDIVYKK